MEESLIDEPEKWLTLFNQW